MIASAVTPSWKQGFARSASDAAYPGLRKGLFAAWYPGLGPTGFSLRDIAGGVGEDGTATPDGTLTSMDPATDWIMTDRGYVLEFDSASTNYVMVSPAGGPFNRFTGEISVVMWWRPNGDYTSTQYLLSNARLNGASIDIRLAFGQTNNQLTWYHGVPILLTSTTSFSSDDWHHVCVTRSGTAGAWTLNMYIDGVLDATTGTATNPSGNSGLSGLSIGRNGVHTAGHLEGQLTQISLHDRPLAPAEVKLLYEDQNALVRRRRRLFPATTVVAAPVGRAYILGGGAGAVLGA